MLLVAAMLQRLIFDGALPRAEAHATRYARDIDYDERKMRCRDSADNVIC